MSGHDAKLPSVGMKALRTTSESLRLDLLMAIDREVWRQLVRMSV